MRASRTQGPVCTQKWDFDVLDGTSSRWAMGSGANDPSQLPYPYLDTGTAMPMEVAPVPSPELGCLSAKHESNGHPGAIGHDTTGGYSYGAYQIATKTHNQVATFRSFIAYLAQNHPDLAKPLRDAGGDHAAQKGTKKFRRAWADLAKHHTLSFAEAQHEFIKMTHYDVQSSALKADYGFDVNERSRALQNVVWSMAVQHGSGTQAIFSRVLAAQPKGTKLTDMADADLIHLLYGERSKVNIYFKNSKQQVKDSVKKRFEDEEKEAMEMLRQEGTPPGATIRSVIP